MSQPPQIPNEQLRADQIPPSNADWGTIGRFALTFDGYQYHGGSAQCAAIANARRNETLTDLRTCLFFEQRRWRHFGDDPDEESMRYIRGVLEQIRGMVARANEARA